jgi:hypothetical protein
LPSSSYPTKVYLGSVQVGTAYDSSAYTTWVTASTATGIIGVDSTVSGAGGTQYTFTKWNEDSSTSNPRASQTMSGPMTFTAVYTTVSSSYTITFTESGLPSGTPWTAIFNGNSQSSPTSTITFTGISAGNGYSWSVSTPITGTPSGTQYITSSASGTMNVPTQTSQSITYTTQYYLTVSTTYGSPTGQGWYNVGSPANFGVTTPTSGGPSTRYVFTSWTGSGANSYNGPNNPGSVTMNNPITETGSWQTQYQMSFVVNPSGAGTISPPGTPQWINAGSPGITITANMNSGYAFSSWSCSPTTSASFSGATSASTTATINGPGTITANFVAVYAITFTETGLPSGTTWTVTFNGQTKYPTTTTVTFTGVLAGSHTWTVSSPISGGSGIQYVAVTNTGTMSVPATTTQLITYQKQYGVTFYSSGVSSDFKGAELNIDGVSYTSAQLPITFWYNTGSAHIFVYQSPLAASANKQYVFTGIASTGTTVIPIDQYGLIVTNSPISITGNYKTQYNVNFGQSGVGNDFTGNVISIDGTNYAANALPVSFWFDSGSTHTFAYQSPLTVNSNQKRYSWSTTIGLSTAQSATITISGAGTITANYKTQYKVTASYSTSDGSTPSANVVLSGTSMGAASLTTLKTTAQTVWLDAGTTWSVNNPIVAASGTAQWIATSGTTGTINVAVTISPLYYHQFKVTLTQSGIGSDFSGTVATIDGTNYAASNLPATFWWTAGSTHTFQYLSPLTGTAHKYTLSSTTGTSTVGTTTTKNGVTSITVTGSGTITGNYAKT